MDIPKHVSDLMKKLEIEGLKPESCSRTKNDNGYRVDCAGGEIINVYDTGTLQVQGKNQDRVRDLRDR